MAFSVSSNWAPFVLVASRNTVQQQQSECEFQSITSRVSMTPTASTGEISLTSQSSSSELSANSLCGGDFSGKFTTRRNVSGSACSISTESTVDQLELFDLESSVSNSSSVQPVSSTLLKEVASEIVHSDILEGYEDISFEVVSEMAHSKMAKRLTRLICDQNTSSVENCEDCQVSLDCKKCDVSASAFDDICISDVSGQEDYSFSRESTDVASDSLVAGDSQLSSEASGSDFVGNNNLDFDTATNFDVVPCGSESLYDGCLAFAKMMVGKWETMLPRSDPLDPLFKQFGIAYLKRVVVDKLAIPLTVTMEDDDMTLHVVIHLPVGNRHMRWRLDGEVSYEDDPDCGEWKGEVQMTTHSVPGLNDGKPFRAFQQKRTHAKIGVVHETRAVVPDATHGRVLYLHYVLSPKKNPTEKVVVVRVLKPAN